MSRSGSNTAIRPYIRSDGRECRPVRLIDFSSDNDSEQDLRQMLEPGFLIGCKLRFYHYDRYRTVSLRGAYTGDSTSVRVPHSKFNPQRAAREVDVPVFDTKLVYRDYRGVVNLGEVAVAYLRPDESPLVSPDRFDIGAQQDELPWQLAQYYQSRPYRLGRVVEASIFCVPVATT